MSYHIYQLVDEDGVLHDPTPDLLANAPKFWLPKPAPL